MSLHRKFYVCLALALLTAGVFWPVKDHEFVNYDDPDYVTANPIVQKGFTAEGVAWAFENIHGEKTYWHPLTWLSHLTDVQLFGLRPAGHHLVNLLFHLGNVLLLFLVIARMTGAFWKSAVVAVLFAIHPLQVDTVAWVTERKNLLSTAFVLLSLMAYVRYAERPSMSRYACVAMLFGAALMSKPAVVAFPCLLLLLDFWPLRRVEIHALVKDEAEDDRQVKFPIVARKRAILEKLPLLALSLASCAVTLLAHQRLGMIDATNHLPLRLRIENAAVSYARYIGKFFWPNDLAVLYPHPGKWPLWQVAFSGLLLLLVTVLVLRRTRRQPWLFTGWFWFLGMLVPAIGLVQVGAQAMADRFVYLPIIGALVMMVWTLGAVASRFPARRWVPVFVSIAAVIFCAFFSVRQLGYWRNSVTLWEHTLRVTKNNYMAHHDLAVALRENGELSEATSHLRAALDIRENSFSHYELSVILERQGNTNSAISQLERSVTLTPRWPTARERLAFLFAQNGDVTNALKQYAELLQNSPGRTDVHFPMAALLSANNRFAETIEHYREVLRSNPNDIAALNNLAWILSTHPDKNLRNGTEAVELAMRACTLTRWKNSVFLATLATAQAETGNYQQATELVAQAQAMALAAGQTNATAELENMRLTFASRNPFRQQKRP